MIKREEKRQRLAQDRVRLLHDQGIDHRLVDAVWGDRFGVLDDLLPARLTDVGWLDDLAVDAPGVVPVVTVRAGQGIVAAKGWLLELDSAPPPIPRDLFWVWRQLLADPIFALLQHELDGAVDQLPIGLRCGGRLDDSLLALELERLRGPVLGDWLVTVVRQARESGELRDPAEELPVSS